MQKLTAVLLLLSLVTSCSSTTNEYQVTINQWHQDRIDFLKSEIGFINLAGLYWLETGVNSFGSDSTNDIIFTDKSLPKMGEFLLKDSLVYLIPRADILIGGSTVLDTTLVFGNDESKNMEYKSLFWFVIKRGDQIGIRLRDLDYYLVNEFDSIDYYETDANWKTEAIWKAYDKPKKVPFSNVFGFSMPYKVYGAFHFKIKGIEYKLEPLGEPEPLGYFTMFYDKTSGNTTYGSGRYMYIKEPDSLGNTFIDFNKAFNPPCAFTEFATCLFPHKENRLPFFVNAGEKFSGH